MIPFWLAVLIQVALFTFGAYLCAACVTWPIPPSKAFRGWRRRRQRRRHTRFTHMED